MILNEIIEIYQPFQFVTYCCGADDLLKPIISYMENGNLIIMLPNLFIQFPYYIGK